MGKKAREKWLRRLRSMEEIMLSKSPPSGGLWYESNLLWFAIATAVAIILTVIAAMIRDLRWLLWIAGLLLWIAVGIASANLFKLWGKRIGCFVLLSGLTGYGLYMLHLHLDPSYIPDAQLCSNVKLFAQNMRDFESERWRSFDETENRYRDLRIAAKSKAERETVQRMANGHYDDWFSSLYRDFSSNYLPTAKNLRAEMLSRLPQINKDKYIDEGAFSGSLAGIRPISNTADQLERMANRLCP